MQCSGSFCKETRLNMKLIKGTRNKRKALIFFFLIIVLFFIPGTLLQLLSAFFLTAISLSFIYSSLIKKAVHAEHTVQQLRIARFEFFEVHIRVENHSFLPIYNLFINDNPGTLSVSADTGRGILNLRPKEILLFSYTINGSTRGEYSIGPLDIRGSDPLGFFPFVKITGSPCRILIYPAKSDETVQLLQGIPQGRVQVNNPLYEDTTLYRNIRDYYNGDEIKRINWKASARFGKLFTNNFQTTLTSPCFVFLDVLINEYSEHLRYEHVEEAIQTAAQIINQATIKGQYCGFASNGFIKGHEDPLFLLPKAGQRIIILDTLARLEFCKGKPNDALLLEKCITRIPSGSTFFYCGPTKKIAESKITIKKLRPSLTIISYGFGEKYE